MSFDLSLPVILEHEGGYVNDPDDRGGATNQGITQKTYTAWLKDNGLKKRDVSRITDAEVADIYRERYWLEGQCDSLSTPSDLIHFDACVNHGPRNAIKILQRSIGVRSDGHFGPKTLAAVQEWHAGDLADAMLWERLRFYRKIVLRDSRQNKFLLGWLSRVLNLRKKL